MNLAEFVLASGLMGAMFALIQQLILWRVKRKAEQQDKAQLAQEKRLEDLEHKLDSIMAGQMAILHDRIKWLGLGYIRNQEVSLDNRRDLVEMHQAYQKNDGDGNLDNLMRQVMELPLSQTKSIDR